MEDAAGAARGPMPSSQASSTARKEWRVVSEHSSRSAGDEEFDRSKLGHSHERTIYEVQQGQELHDVMNFCSVQMDGGLDNDSEQKLQNLAKKREELQEMEIQLRAHMIASSTVVEMENSFDSQIKEQAGVIADLQERLDEREQRLMELNSKMEVQERELHAIRLDNEAAWAKEDLLREQNKELANFRRERDNVEAERAHRVKQIHDLQEHIQEKDRQAMELQEQHRIAQETVLYKEEQLREAQTWIARVQEMDALQSSAYHTVQAELRERTEQYNQLWLGCQRQFMEMERLHVQTIQQLQLELSEAREKSGTYNDESHASKPKSNDMPHGGENNGNHLEANESGGGASSENSASASNGHSENSHSFALSGQASAQINHAPVPVAPPSLLGVASYLPPGQVTVHPYVLHQQGANHSVPQSVYQSYVGHFPTTSAMASYQHWQGQQAVTDGLQGSLSPSEAENNLAMSASNYSYETSVNGQDLHPYHHNTHSSQRVEASSGISSTEVPDEGYLTSQRQEALQKISSHFHEALGLTSVGQTAEIKENDVIGLTNDNLESRDVETEPSKSSQSPSPSVKITNPVSSAETKINNTVDGFLAEVPVSVGQTNTVPPRGTSGPALLDERSLLTCIVRTIPAGGKIRISSSLPNRLGKMLVPLHWHDYKNKYGRLDDFVASHPELFLVEGDYIQLREGAQGIIAATAAVAKVAAAAAATSPYTSSLFPPMALTPMAQANRLKKTPSAELNSVGNDVKVMTKSEDSLNINAPAGQFGQSSVSHLRENGLSSDRSGLDATQSKGKLNARSGANNISKQHGRAVPTQILSRR